VTFAEEAGRAERTNGHARAAEVAVIAPTRKRAAAASRAR
jgi:hypothetical protein